MITLLLGGARSGKSRHAQTLAEQSGQRCVYLATGWAGDDEMQQRIEQHRQDRDERWHTVEEPVQLAQALTRHDNPGQITVVDCLTLWLSNCLAQDCWPTESAALLGVLPGLTNDVIFVSNEVGSGIVPLGPLNRTFADEAGRLHQAIARQADYVALLVAGIPLSLKGGLRPDV